MKKMYCINDEIYENLMKKISDEGSSLKKSESNYKIVKIENIEMLKKVFNKLAIMLNEKEVKSDMFEIDREKGITVNFEYNKTDDELTCYCSYLCDLGFGKSIIGNYYIVGFEKDSCNKNYLIEDLNKECFISLCNNLDFFYNDLLLKMQQEMAELKSLKNLTEIF